MKFITIDGIDKSGKSTIIQGVFKATNGNVFIVDRSPSSWHFFNLLLNRVKHESIYTKAYNNKLKDFRKVVDLSIILTVEEDDWLCRCEKHNEPELVGDLPFLEHQRELVRYFDKAKYPNVLRLNTTNTSSEDCINQILDRLNHRR